MRTKANDMIKTILTILVTLLAYDAYGQSSANQDRHPELRELEIPILKSCDKNLGGPAITKCLIDETLKLEKTIQDQFKDDCRWSIWSQEATILCFDKAQHEGQGTSFDRRVAYCLITQNLLLYGEFLDQKLGGNRTVDDRLLDLYNDPDAPQILPLQELRKKILDKNSKEVKCEQRPMV